MAAETIVGVLRQASGWHLNAEVVDAFLSVFPRYPVGVDLVVVEGRYEGCRGVVLATNATALDRPRIQLTRDALGHAISPPLLVDLAAEPATQITCIVEDVLVPA